MKRFNKTINVTMVALIFAYVVRIIYAVCRLIFNPEYYMVTSAPWYTGIIVDGIVVAIALLICALCKLIIFIKNKKTEKS